MKTNICLFPMLAIGVIVSTAIAENAPSSSMGGAAAKLIVSSQPKLPTMALPPPVLLVDLRPSRTARPYRKVPQSLPGEIVRALPHEMVRALPGQVVRALPDQLVPVLPGQVVGMLPGQFVPPLPGQITPALPGQVGP
jgi:hypothetical protein